jgi:hypothetical protein
MRTREHAMPLTLSRRLTTLGLAASLALVASACGKDKGSSMSPTSPSVPATPTLSSLSIGGEPAIRTGTSGDYTATATLSNGTSQVVTATWTSGDSAVATVDASGRVTGVTHGTVILTASYQGMTASRSIGVVNNYAGSWSGAVELRSCDQSGAFAASEWCESFGVGTRRPVGLVLTQTGSDRSQVSGTISLGSIGGAVSGSVTSEGHLNIGGTFGVTLEGLTINFTVGGWDTSLGSPNEMTGHWALNQTAPGYAGNAYLELTFVSMVRITPGAAAAGPAGARWEPRFRVKGSLE